MTETPAEPRDRRLSTSGIFRRFRRSAIASDLLPEAVDRHLGPEGTAKPRPALPAPSDPARTK